MIKILIVDDNPAKQDNLKRTIIEDGGISASFLKIVPSTKKAEKYLRQEYFDLMILDLVLPIEENGECSPKNAINFLNKIAISPFIKPPIHIVGVSGYRDKISEYNNEFKMKLWNLIEYCEDGSNWQSQLTSIIFHLVKTRERFLSSSLENRLKVLFSGLEKKGYPNTFLGCDWISICKNLIQIIEKSLEVPSKFSNGSKAKNINSSSVKITNEYDFQNLIHLVIRPWLPSMEAENIAVVFDGNTKYADFSIKGNAIIIEAKYIDTTGKKNDTLKTIEGLKNFYKKNANVRAILFLIIVEKNVTMDRHKIEAEFTNHFEEPHVFVKIYENKLSK